MRANGSTFVLFVAASFVVVNAAAVEPPAIRPAVVAADEEPSPKPRLDDAVTDLLRQTALALQSRSIDDAERPLFYDLMTAADLLRADQTLAPSERERLRALVRVRLQQASEVLRRDKKRATEAVAGGNSAEKLAAGPASVAVPPRQTVFAQFAPGLGGQFGGGAQQASSPVQQSADDLIELITETIQPDTWQQNGGNGVIRFWAVGNALVIRNTSSVHGGIGDLIDQLRQ